MAEKKITEKKAVVFNIMRYCIHDGPGIRTTVFLKGCPLSCKWCHNPEGIKKEPEQSGQEIIGYEITKEDLMKEIKKDALFYEQSGGGVTFSGGEPFFQSDFLLDIMEQCKKDFLKTAVDTCGYCDTQILLEAAKLTDYFLYDIKFKDSSKHEKYCGLPNDIILENLKILSKTKTKILIRLPVIPSINDSLSEMTDIYDLIKDFPNIETVHLLPYHNIYSGKNEKLEKQYSNINISNEKSTDIKIIEKIFSRKFKTKIGG